MRLIFSSTRDLMQFHARLGRALGDPAVRRWRRASRTPAEMPALDVSETPECFLVRLDVPGMGKDEIEVKVAEGTLEIAGEVPAASSTDERAQPRRLERFRGPFRRTVPLPRHVDGGAIQATLTQGVLTLQVPKLAPAAGRRIEIG